MDFSSNWMIQHFLGHICNTHEVKFLDSKWSHRISHNDQFLFKIKIWIVWWRCLELICYNRWLDACSAVNEFIFRLQAGLKIFILFFATDLNRPLASSCRVRVSCSWISTFEIILIWDLWIESLEWLNKVESINWPCVRADASEIVLIQFLHRKISHI